MDLKTCDLVLGFRSGSQTIQITVLTMCLCLCTWGVCVCLHLLCDVGYLYVKALCVFVCEYWVSLWSGLIIAASACCWSEWCRWGLNLLLRLSWWAAAVVRPLTLLPGPPYPHPTHSLAFQLDFDLGSLIWCCWKNVHLHTEASESVDENSCKTSVTAAHQHWFGDVRVRRCLGWKVIAIFWIVLFKCIKKQSKD